MSVADPKPLRALAERLRAGLVNIWDLRKAADMLDRLAPQSAPVPNAPHNSGERLPSSNAASAGADTRLATPPALRGEGERREQIARAICKSKTCEGFKCCQWPGSMGRKHDCPVDRGGYDDAADAVLAILRSDPIPTAGAVAIGYVTKDTIENLRTNSSAFSVIVFAAAHDNLVPLYATPPVSLDERDSVQGSIADGGQCNEQPARSLSVPSALDEWIAYAEKLERALEIISDQSADKLKAAQAKAALENERPTLRVIK